MATQTYCFAFGSNLDILRMRRRCPHAAPIAIAELRGYQLAFAGHSTSWGGAVATIVPARGWTVPGLVYRMPKEELLLLDGYEGHPRVYRRARRRVVNGAGDARFAHVYALPKTTPVGTPSPEYLGVIARAYRLYGFDRRELAAALTERNDS